jgi:hypothetical protein
MDRGSRLASIDASLYKYRGAPSRTIKGQKSGASPIDSQTAERVRKKTAPARECAGPFFGEEEWLPLHEFDGGDAEDADAEKEDGAGFGGGGASDNGICNGKRLECRRGKTKGC